jgi:hypothetical protein
MRNPEGPPLSQMYVSGVDDADQARKAAKEDAPEYDIGICGVCGSYGRLGFPCWRKDEGEYL